MPDARNAGALGRDKLIFQQRATGQDGWGNEVGSGEFEDQFTVSANLRPLHGGEGVIAARLSGQQPYVITVRQSSQTRQITAGWQIVHAYNRNRVFAITAPPTDPDGKRAWLEILATEGAIS